MSLAFILVLIAAFSLGVQRVFERIGFGVHVTSVVYLLVGGALGRFGAGVLGVDSIEALQPVISLMMGIMGFILGLPLSHAIRNTAFASTGFAASIGLGGIVGGACFAVLHFYLGSELGIDKADQLWLAIALGAAGTSVSTPLISLTVRSIRARGPVTESLLAWAMVSNILCVVVAGGALAMSRALATDQVVASLTKTEWLVACAGIGIICGILYTLFLGRESEQSQDRTFLATVAIVVFASGLAAAMGVSPMLVNLFAGLTTSLFHRKTTALYQALQGLYGPACAMLAILAGAMWSPPPIMVWSLALMYLSTRVVAGYLFGAIAARMAEPRINVSRFGAGIWGQGALAIAVGVNFVQINPELAPVVLNTLFLAVILSDIIGPLVVRTVLIDGGEIESSAHSKAIAATSKTTTEVSP